MPAWFPAAAGLGALAVAIALAVCIRMDEKRYVSQLAQQAAKTAAAQLESSLRGYLAALDDQVQEMEAEGIPSFETWHRRMAQVRRHFPQLSRISFTDADFIFRRVEPLEGNDSLIGRDVRTLPGRGPAYERARATGRQEVLSPILRYAGGLGFVIISPIRSRGEFAGFLGTSWDYSSFFREIFKSSAIPDYYIQVFDGDSLLFGPRTLPADSPAFACNTFVSLFDHQWRVVLSPERSIIDRQIGLVDSAIIAAGAIVALLIVLVLNRVRSEQRLRMQLELLNGTLQSQVLARTEKIQHIAQELIQAEHAERERIARVLHDDLQQQLVALKMQLERARMRPEHGVKSMEMAGELIGSAIATSRSLSREIHPSILSHEGILPGLEVLTHEFNERFGLKVLMNAEKFTPGKPSTLDVLLYDAARELLFNVVKHSGVKEAEISLSNDGNEVRLTVSDRGAGFEPDVAAAESGHGLARLKDRIDIFEGHRILITGPGRGTSVTIIIDASLVTARIARRKAAGENTDPKLTLR